MTTNAYLPLTEQDRTEMLETLNLRSMEDLLSVIPKNLKRPEIRIGTSLSELELEKEINRKIESFGGSGSRFLSFLGGGVYEHFIPASVPYLSSRGEFLTAYTPYQPEASQGTLQAIFEFQTMISDLMGMDVSNASHYDGSTALAESALIAVQHTKRKKILVSETVHPDYRAVLKTYLGAFDCEVIDIPFSKTGAYDASAFAKNLTSEIACFISQTPNFFGVIENYQNIRQMLDEVGALFVLAVNPISMGVLKSPGEWGADLACGEGQPLGLAPSFGGPFLGFMTAKNYLVRKLPGRLAGQTVDADGKRSFVLTLQAREQHIRRQRASSNICTNQGLCMLRACIYLAAVGAQGLKQIASINLSNAAYLKQKLKEIPGCEIVFTGDSFNETVVRFNKPLPPLVAECKKKNILPGILVEKFYPSLKDSLLVCVTETKDRQEIDHFVAALKEIVKDS